MIEMAKRCEHCEHTKKSIESDSLNEVEVIFQLQDPSTMMALQHFSVKMKDKKRPAKNLLKDAKEQLDEMLRKSRRTIEKQKGVDVS